MIGENRRRLIDALRNNPEGWDMCYSSSCAMGVASRLGITGPATTTLDMAVALGISHATARAIFTPVPYREPHLYSVVPISSITPEMVANQLERAINVD